MKRNFHGASGGYNCLRARNLTFKKVVKEVMKDRLNNQFMIQMEKMIRTIFREEFDRRIQPYLSSSLTQIERSRFETPSSRSRFKLRFINAPQMSIFTASKIETEERTAVAFELVDAVTNARIVSGPLSSSRVEIVPLDGDFTEETWPVDGFKRNILKQREGKRPLLTGDLTVTLTNGVGEIPENVGFTDNSSWTRSGKFRLGAKLTGGGAVEAKSEPFGCKDQRGKSYEKHHPLYPEDEVWRLEKIAKDGASAKRLAQNGILKVKDFRGLHAINPTALYNIFQGKISNKKWRAIISHAMDCVVDEKECYIHNANAHGVSLLLNSVYEVIKISFNGSCGPFRHIDDQVDEPILYDLKLEAYQSRENFTKVDGRIFAEDHPHRSLQATQNPGFGVACPELQYMDIQGCFDPSNSSMSAYLPTSSHTASTATFHIDEKFLSKTLRDSFRVREHDHVHGESSQQNVVTRGYNIDTTRMHSITDDDNICEENVEDKNLFVDYHDHENWSPGMNQWTQQTLEGLCVRVSSTEEDRMFDVRIANINVGSPRGRWCKLKAAVKIKEVWRSARNRNRGL
ncbi:unnamed protein product [Cochlearia groenlandica]